MRNAAALLIVLLALVVTRMLGSWHPQAALTARGVLTREIDTLTAGALLATLAESARAGAERGLDRGVLLDPVRERVFAVLDDAVDTYMLA